MNNLAVYWNSYTRMVTDLPDKQQVREALEMTIARNGQEHPKDHKYVLAPIKMEVSVTNKFCIVISRLTF